MYIVAEEIADNPTAIARGHKERRTAVRHRQRPYAASGRSLSAVA